MNFVLRISEPVPQTHIFGKKFYYSVKIFPHFFFSISKVTVFGSGIWDPVSVILNG
jgi:hypothetical protein